MDVPVRLNITERQHTRKEGDAAEDYEDPTDDRNRTWPLHWATDYTDLGRMTNATAPVVHSVDTRAPQHSQLRILNAAGWSRVF